MGWATESGHRPVPIALLHCLSYRPTRGMFIEPPPNTTRTYLEALIIAAPARHELSTMPCVLSFLARVHADESPVIDVCMGTVYG